jgi:pyridoxal phosphate enzyme (YggS family)
MQTLQDNIQAIQRVLTPANVSLVAVSKTKPISLIEDTYKLGIRDFGENKIQELVTKYETLPKDIRWHMIGHLQKNKVKYIGAFVHLIHSIDSLKLLKEVNKQALKHERVIDCLLQIHVAEEESKFGLKPNELSEMLQSQEFKELKNIRIRGLMSMATFTENKNQISAEFQKTKELFDKTKIDFFNQNSSFDTLSMGMSGDFELAIEEGSNMVRLGSIIFGKRS